jgi:Glutaredoxin-like domain (DUF836)
VIALTLYTRSQCHLCEHMLADLKPLIEGKARVDVVDIDSDAALILRFGEIVPVLMHGGDEISRLRLDRDRVLSLIA